MCLNNENTNYIAVLGNFHTELLTFFPNLREATKPPIIPCQQCDIKKHAQDYSLLSHDKR